MELWFTEKHKKGVGLTLKIKRCLLSKRSRYQKIDVLETKEFGKMLLLDGLVMTSERDEFIYHEMLIHPAMHIHKNVQKVLIIGGGDGGAVREVIKYPSVKEVILCEIDEDVIEISKQYFPSISSGLHDSRVKIVCEDGAKFLKKVRSKEFDIIFVDSTDPIGAAKALFSRDFYGLCLNTLDDNGLLVAQSESPFYHIDIIKAMKLDVITAGFKWLKFYTAPIPTYPAGYWSWLVASKNDNNFRLLFTKILSDNQYNQLKYYNKDIHLSAFSLPNFFKEALKSNY